LDIVDTTGVLRLVFLLGPIVVLLGLGCFLALRSGVVSLGTGQGLRQLIGNLSQMIVQVAAYVIGLVLIQEMVGFHLGAMW
jgi:hypothetical protein